jgi:hypothetical protein
MNLLKDDEAKRIYERRNLRLKNVDERDLRELDRFLSVFKYDVGYHNLKLYFKTSPDTWRIALDENNKVATPKKFIFSTK